MSAPHYTTAFGAILDDEIAGALRAGMPIEHIYAELSARLREVQQAVVAKFQQLEAQRCEA